MSEITPVVPPVEPATSPKSKPHVLSMIALVTAVLGFLFACIPGALIVGWILLPIAFVLSLVALFLKGKKWPAIVGLILAVVGTIVGFVVFFALAAGAVNDALDDSNLTSPGGGGGGSEPAATESAAPDENPDNGFTVTIDDASQTTDYEGKPVLVVNYTFANNGAEDASFMFTVSAKAFQNGVELDTAIVTDDTFDSSAGLKDIKPGASISVPMAYLLSDTSEVTVEVSELLNFDGTIVASKVFSVQ
ncbi:DUF5067 domain-containing protein [Microbacterium sp.]|uniref:DUF5067 domain-containing protein n=1 Tax=Microbacterium sp. TaxID=51671 RepID=UPI0039E311C2